MARENSKARMYDDGPMRRSMMRGHDAGSIVQHGSHGRTGRGGLGSLGASQAPNRERRGGLGGCSGHGALPQMPRQPRRCGSTDANDVACCRQHHTKSQPATAQSRLSPPLNQRKLLLPRRQPPNQPKSINQPPLTSLYPSSPVHLHSSHNASHLLHAPVARPYGVAAAEPAPTTLLDQVQPLLRKGPSW